MSAYFDNLIRHDSSALVDAAVNLTFALVLFSKKCCRLLFAAPWAPSKYLLV